MAHTKIPRMGTGRGGAIFAGAMFMLTLLTLLAPAAHAQGNPPGCSGVGIGMSLIPIVDGAGTSGPVLEGTEVEYEVTLFNTSATGCNFVGGQLSVTFPDGTVVPVAGFPDTPPIPVVEFGVRLEFAVPGIYVVSNSDADPDGFVRAFANYGSTVQQPAQKNGTILSDPPLQKASQTTAGPLGIGDIDITKSSDVDRVCEGEDTIVTYTYAVTTGVGSVAVEGITVSDDLCGPVIFDGGDDDGSKQLEPGETWMYSCSMPINGTTTNVASVTASTFVGGLSVQATDTVTVTANPLPLCSIGGAEKLCSAAASDYCGPPGVATYQWSISGDAEIISAVDQMCVTVLPTATGSFTLSLATTSDAGCPNTCQTEVTVAVETECSIMGDDAVCSDETSVQFCGPRGRDSYLWLVTGDGVIVGKNSNTCVNVAPTGPGSFTVSLETSESGCESVCQKTVDVNAVPACSIGGDTVVCSDSQNNVYCAPGGRRNYQWSITGNGTIIGPDNAQCVTIDAGVSGSYTLSLDVGGNGCLASCSLPVTIAAEVPCSIGGPESVCGGGSETFCGPSGPYTYMWTVIGNGEIAGPADGACIDVIFDPGGGDFTVMLDIEDANGCGNACEVTVPVGENPACSIDGPDPVCANSSGQVYCAPAGAATYDWSITGNGQINGATDGQCVSVDAFGAGTYTLTLTTTDQSGCPATCTRTVTVSIDAIECEILGPAAVCEGSTGNMFCGPAGMAGYAWSITGPGATIDGPADEQCVSVNVTNAGLFTVHLTVTDPSGCTCKSSLQVDAGTGPSMVLRFTEEPTCRHPQSAELVVVELWMVDVAAAGIPITSWQAFINYDNSLLAFVDGQYSGAPFEMPIVTPIDERVPGRIRAAAGTLQGGTTQDALLATFRFLVIDGKCESTNFDFDTTGQQNVLIGEGVIEIKPCLGKSPEMLIDADPPKISSCCDTVVLDADPKTCNAILPDLTTCPELVFNDNCSTIITVKQKPEAGTKLELGSTFVTIEVTDCAGNSDTCQVEVEVRDTLPPVIHSCPPDRLLKVDNDCVVRVPDLTGQIDAKDNCDNPTLLTITQDPEPDTEITLGKTTVTVTVADDFGNTSECQVSIEVIDSDPPKIAQCAPLMEIEADGTCMAKVPDLRGKVIAIDNCTLNTSLVYTQIPIAGTPIGLGETEVTISVWDDQGFQDTCTTTITVVDTTDPKIAACPEKLEIPLDEACFGKFPDLTGQVQAIDNCDDDLDIEQSIEPGGAIIGLGSATVIITVTDDAGNSAQCTIDVTTVDTDGPVILDCGPDLKIPAGDDCGAIMPQVDGGVVAVDNCTLTGNLEVTQEPALGEPIPFGVTKAILTVTDDAGNSSSCTVTVTVNDDTPPEIECPPNLTFECTNPDGVKDIKLDVTAEDMCDPDPGINCFRLDSGGNIIGLINPTGADFPIGRTFVLCRATDKAGNFSTCLFSVTVADTEGPEVTCDVGGTVEAGPNCTYVLPDLTDGVVVKDTCTELEDISIQQSPPAGSQLGIGSTLVTFIVTDAAGNTETCKAKLDVVDGQAPNLTCPAGINVKAGLNCFGQVPDYTIGAFASDACSKDVTLEQSPAPSSNLPLGTHVIILTATDDAGNSATCATALVVSDESDPTIITCGGDVAVEVNDDCEAKLPDLTGDVVADDNCDANLKVTQEPKPGATIEAGTTAVTIIVTDASGNSATCTRNVTASDQTAPKILCPGDITATTDADVCSARVDAGTAEATDNCDDEVQVKGYRDDGQPLDAPYPAGGTAITWTATDASGNEAECVQTITVLDNDPPLITCPSNIATDADSGMCSADINPGQATARDSCDSNLQIKGVRNDGFDLNDPYPLGVTMITWTATDDAGNEASCTQIISVSGSQTLLVDIELQGAVNAAFTRCITFELSTCNPPMSATVSTDITFVNGRADNVPVSVPCGVQWQCVTARDRLHTLRRTNDDVIQSGDDLMVDFTGPRALLAGDINDDGAANIIDATLLNLRLWTDYGSGDTECGSDFDPETNPNADLNGDGLVNQLDAALMSANLAVKDDPGCCGGAGAAATADPNKMTIRVDELTKLGINGTAADLNHDGVVDRTDLDLFRQRDLTPAAGTDWFDASQWSNDLVPDADTDVTLTTPVVIAHGDAAAREILVGNGGTLTLGAGSLFATTVTVDAGGTLVLDDAEALLAVESLIVSDGATVEWNQGTVEIAAGVLVVESSLDIGLTAGVATLRLFDNATGVIDGDLAIGVDADSEALVELDGSDTSLTIGGEIEIGLNGRLERVVDDSALEPRRGEISFLRQ